MTSNGMTTELYNALRYAKTGEELRARLAAASVPVLAGGDGVPFTNGTVGYRALFTLADGVTWMAVQFSPRGEFTVMKTSDTENNRAQFAKPVEWSRAWR